MANDRELKVIISAQDDYSVALKKFNAAVGETSGGIGKLSGAVELLAGRWMEILTLAGASAWFVEARKKALESEVAFNKLRIQVNNLGRSYEALTPEIEKALDRTSQYARVQDDEAAKALQQLILQTGNYQKSLSSLDRVYDLAYLANIEAGEAAVIYGKAIAGNVEGLSRFFPELKNVDEILGKNATTADKAAYAQAFLAEKVTGAKEKMTEHEKAAERLHLTYEKFHEVTGWVVVGMGDELIKALKAPISYFNDLTDAIDRAAHALNPYIELPKERIELAIKEAQAVQMVGSAHQKTKEQIAAESNKKSKAIEAEKLHIEELKKLAEIFKRNEETIISVDEAVAKLRGDESGLLTVEAQKLVMAGATTGQLERYLELRKEQIELEKLADPKKIMLSVPDYSTGWEDITNARLKAEEEYDKKLFSDKVTAMGKLSELEKTSPYGAQKGLEEAAQKSEVAKIYLDYQIKLDALQEYNTQKLAMMVQAGESEDEVERAYSKMNIAAAAKEKEFKIAAASSAFGAMSNMMQNLFVATGKHNRAMFEAGKAFAVAQTAIDTYQASMAAYKALSGIPIVGPALAAAAAASIVATGLARVKEISSMQPGGGSIGAGGEANPSYSGGSPNAYPIPQRLETPQQAQNVTINIYNPLSEQNWDKIVQDNLVPALNKTGDMNIPLNINVVKN